MNKYAALGLFATAQAGTKVVVITESERATVHEMREFDHLIPELRSSITVRRSAGHERIEFASGGTIRFISRRSMLLRGTSADKVYVDCAIDDPIELHRLRLMTAASPQGELIRA